MNNAIVTLISTVYIVAILGWLINLVESIKFMISGAEWGVFEILQAVGIFAVPLGSVMGWVSLFV